ncbi:hypothetical protein [Rhodococcus sp. NCIMB 12038]|uniref:hypothetical protein n=1 Tax=Rhodococcus sp. NCIMB 12038 TaxID=933800 RepID=UPI00211B517D|nr:hypothetical protein [Rhodococcus sp. NCIMB 12038]
MQQSGRRPLCEAEKHPAREERGERRSHDEREHDDIPQLGDDCYGPADRENFVDRSAKKPPKLKARRNMLPVKPIWEALSPRSSLSGLAMSLTFGLVRETTPSTAG